MELHRLPTASIVDCLLVHEPRVLWFSHLSLQLTCLVIGDNTHLHPCDLISGSVDVLCPYHGDGFFPCKTVGSGPIPKRVLVIRHYYPHFSLSRESGLTSAAVAWALEEADEAPEHGRD